MLWRTPHLVSNGRFVVRGCYIVAGYGFTGEPDFLYLLDRATGRLLEKHWVSTAPQQYHLRGDDALDVELYSGAQRRFRLRDFDRRDGALVPLDAPEVGGDGYGGYGAQLP